MMLPDSVPSVMPPTDECGEQELWNGDSEDEQEVWSTPSKKKCDEVETTGVGNEETENCEDIVEEPKVGMTFDTSDEAYLHYSRYGKEKGFAVATRSSKKGKDGKLKNVVIVCSRGGKARVTTSNPVKPRPQSKIGCPARVIVVLHPDEKWRLTQVDLEHNHDISPGKVRYFRCNRILDEHVKRRLELNDEAGISVRKTYDSLKIEAGGPSKLPFFKKDCRNHVDKKRRSLLVQGDAEAMHNYFMKMKADNSDFFYAMDLDDDDRLRNVFWADARSRAACKEFGDVLTFDTTYLVNRHDMPFAPFVGVNHHGQSILLGCGLISHETSESFKWLFQTWKTCMWGCAPRAIITDQCLAMKSAIEIVFLNTRHRWCIWHIMKKVPEKLNGCKNYEQIRYWMRKAVYDSLTIKEFEDSWDVFIKKYELQSNTWLDGLYSERERWVPAYLKDIFWAGMSSTQRSESVNAYFDGYVQSKTTLKQFVGQYENALADKVESENHEDVKSWGTFIPLIREGDDLENQFQRAYTNAKFKEFHEEFVGKLDCMCSKTKQEGIMSEYEVKQRVMYGEAEERMKKLVSFVVHFNSETNETHCNCRLFEFKGMVCRHQLMVWFIENVERVPDKYVLRRWCKNMKRAHTKIRICYDKASRSVEARRHDKMCSRFNEVADLAEESEEKYVEVMKRLEELKLELKETLVVCESNAVSLGDDTGTPNITFSLGDGVLPSKQSTNILDPKGLQRKGRPRLKRMIGVVDKAITKKRQTKKKELSKEVREIVNGNHNGTQESVVNANGQSSYMGHSMSPNIMPHTMRPNMAQGGSIIQFSPTFGPNRTSLNQNMSFFTSSQSLSGGQFWEGGQFWGGQSSILGELYPTNLQTQVQTRGQECRGQQSYTEMMNAPDGGEE